MATDDKYDRQLRLWGANGQKALMHSHILLVNAGPTGTETLKNLVLPGVGEFTILDGAKVTPRDTGNNFFVLKEHVGRPRAEVTTELLCEMNSDVKGHARVAQPKAVIEKEPEFFQQFTLVIASQMDITSLRALAKICWEGGVPLVVAKSVGLLGVVRVQMKDHQVVESKPSNDRQDLRISCPWPELRAHCMEVDMSALDSKDHGHIPFIVILLQQMEAWRAKHGGGNSNSKPATIEEKDQFKEDIKAASRKYDHELNFQEAWADAYKAYAAPPELPADVQDILDDERTANLTNASTNFRVMACALKGFIADDGPEGGCGLPPLAGQIPDMTSDTDRFIALQQVYEAKASKDRDAMAKRVGDLLDSLGRERDAIPRAEVDEFCKNAQNLQCLQSSSLEEEYAMPLPENIKEEVDMAVGDPFDRPAQTPLFWYVALRARDRFEEKHGRVPGLKDDTLISDGMTLWNETRAMLKEWGVSIPHVTKQHATELTRYGDVELHVIASVVGGIASQEVVKLLTHQYTPVKSTVVYNGIAGVVGAYDV